MLLVDFDAVDFFAVELLEVVVFFGVDEEDELVGVVLGVLKA